MPAVVFGPTLIFSDVCALGRGEIRAPILNHSHHPPLSLDVGVTEKDAEIYPGNGTEPFDADVCALVLGRVHVQVGCLDYARIHQTSCGIRQPPRPSTCPLRPAACWPTAEEGSPHDPYIPSAQVNRRQRAPRSTAGQPRVPRLRSRSRTSPGSKHRIKKCGVDLTWPTTWPRHPWKAAAIPLVAEVDYRPE